MSVAVTILILVTGWLVVTATLRKYREYRRSTTSGREWQEYTAKLPGWMKTTELLIQGDALVCMSSLLTKHSAMTPPGTSSGPATGLIIFASLIGMLVPGMLIANSISWAIPPLRRANLAAIDGFAIASFRSAQIGLLKLGAIVGVICAAIAALAVYAPWGR